MAKKRKVSGGAPVAEPTEGWNEQGGKLAFKSYEDLADAQDDFHINRDKVMLDDGPDAKRRRKWEQEDAALQPSDEEILGYSSASDNDDDDEVDDVKDAGRGNGNNDSMGGEDAEEEEEEGWGAKRDYYTTETIESKYDAEAEEEEAKRIQKKRLEKMTAADFGFDEDEWRDATAEDGKTEQTTITEALVDFEITPGMTQKERLQILSTHYPEFEFLANDFVSLHPTSQKLQRELENEPANTTGSNSGPSIPMTKYRALTAYMSSLAMYFAILSSPARKSDSVKPLSPAELHDHPVMDTIMKCRDTWNRVKSLTAPTIIDTVSDDASPEPILLTNGSNGSESKQTKNSKKSKKQEALEAAAEEAAAERAARIEEAEEELADLSSLLPKSRKSKKSQPIVFREDEDNSDFGEETHLSTRAAAEKAQKKKSLRFYTSQIAQKSNRRADAGRDAGGDMDVPYKERLKDRQARLNAEAEKRGKKLDEYGRGADLGGDSDEEDAPAAKEVRGEDDDYYDMVAQTSKQRKLEKEAKYDAIKEAKAKNAIVRVVEGEVDDDGKRAIGYVIEKNKGLAPKRKKDVRNPRVKKRKKYEEKKKKLSSMKAVYKGGEERGGYSGEKTGIKTGLVKSIKL